METQISPMQQQKRAKLNLLRLDDDHGEEQKIAQIEQEHWGRSLQTQSYLRQKLSQRYKGKSYRQMRTTSITCKENRVRRHFNSDKQSLKDLLKKLQSKEMKVSKDQSLSNSMVVEFNKLSNAQKSAKNTHEANQHKCSNRSNKSTIEQRNVQKITLPKGLRESFQSGQNNFISKKMEIKDPNRSYRNELQSLLPPENQFIEPKFSKRDEFAKKREFATENKRRKIVVRKSTQNKQNEIVGFFELPVQNEYPLSTLKHSLLSLKKQNHKFLQSTSISKRTFQILQQINQSKSINSTKKLTSQSLKLKKPQMCPYSRVLKDRSNFNTQNKPNSGSVLVSSNKSENIWLKLQIRR